MWFSVRVDRIYRNDSIFPEKGINANIIVKADDEYEALIKLQKKLGGKVSAENDGYFLKVTSEVYVANYRVEVAEVID